MNNKKSNLIGGARGGARVLPKFNGDMNDPAITREQKASKSVHYKDKVKMDQAYERIHPPPEPPQPMMQMTMMDSALGDKKPVAKPPAYIYPSSTVPMPNPNNPVASNYMIPWNHNQLNVPIIKKYNISIQGMDGNITSASQIFEDILPETNMALNRMTTLDERTVLHSYIRSILLKRGDGEKVAFNDKKPELINLLSYLKMMEINPYHFSRITNNSHKTLADNFIMFRSCYPIRLDKKSSNISCATDNIGANIRVYSMSVYDQMAQILDTGSIRKVFSDVWREIMFYTFIREEILKKNICPHFAFLHTYYVTENNSIDFDKLKQIKHTTDIKNEEFVESNKKIKKSMFKAEMDNIIHTGKGYTINVDFNAYSELKNTDVIKFNDLHIRNTRLRSLKTITVDNEEYDINSRGTQCVVAITEAPDQNIVDWSTRTYVIEESAVRKQITSGYHSDLTWQSILFQLLYTYTTMFKYKFAIRDFQWGKNLYIKTFDDAGNVGFWKYNVDKIQFFIPNMKALLMVDSCFDPVQNGYSPDNGLDHNFHFKTEGDFYNTPTSIVTDAITSVTTPIRDPSLNDLLVDVFKNMFDPTVLTQTFKNYGGVEPNKNIRDLMDRIYRMGSGSPMSGDVLKNIFLKEFGFFLHNKIGDNVDQVDEQQLHQPGYNVRECKKGDLVAYNNGTAMRVYVWAIIIDVNVSIEVLVKENELYVIKQASHRQIRRVFGTISQKYKPEQKINSFDEVLSSYNLFL